ncbi:hypothetical protein GCM10023206_08840 [Acinetobacter puyangensis]
MDNFVFEFKKISAIKLYLRFAQVYPQFKFFKFKMKNISCCFNYPHCFKFKSGVIGGNFLNLKNKWGGV